MNIKYAMRLIHPDGSTLYRSTNGDDFFEDWDKAQLWASLKSVLQAVKKLRRDRTFGIVWDGEKTTRFELEGCRISVHEVTIEEPL